ncbi:MAG: YihY/virulence factor BrkB family protein [Bacillaceae bacterium]
MRTIRNYQTVKWGIALIQRYSTDKIGSLSAELAYFFLLSLFPLLIVLTQLLRFVPFEVDTMLQLIAQYAPEQAMNLIEHTLKEITGKQGTGLLSFSILFTVWVASKGVDGIMRGLNKAYRISKERSYFIMRGMSYLMTVLLIFVIIFSLFIPVLGKIIGEYLLSLFSANAVVFFIWGIIRLLLSFTVLFMVFLFMYKYVPFKKLKWHEIWPGALFATLGWIGASYIFAYYVENFGNYTSTYGSLGGIIILLIWFYLTAIIILIGGELNALYYSIRNKLDFIV